MGRFSALARSSPVDALAELEAAWAAGGGLDAVAARLGVSLSTLRRLAAALLFRAQIVADPASGVKRDNRGRFRTVTPPAE